MFAFVVRFRCLGWLFISSVWVKKYIFAAELYTTIVVTIYYLVSNYFIGIWKHIIGKHLLWSEASPSFHHWSYRFQWTSEEKPYLLKKIGENMLSVHMLAKSWNIQKKSFLSAPAPKLISSCSVASFIGIPFGSKSLMAVVDFGQQYIAILLNGKCYLMDLLVISSPSLLVEIWSVCSATIIWAL